MIALTEEECAHYQAQIRLFAQLIMTWDKAFITRYLKETQPLADGTLDVVIPHFMSLLDMREGQNNLKFLRAMGGHVLAVQDTILKYRGPVPHD